MRKIIFLFAVAAGALSLPASAANDFNVIQAGGAVRTKCAMDVGSGRLADCATIFNTANNQINPATNESVDGIEAMLATENTNSTAISSKLPSTLGPKTGGNSLSVVPASDGFNINCVSGCSGGTAYTEDAVAAADPTGVAIISRRRDTLSVSEVSADGDNIGLVSTSKGELRINDNSLNTAFGTVSDAASTSGSATAQGYLRSMRDDLRTLATDTSPLSTYGFAGTATTSFARPADTTAYTANDIISDSTSAPTSGGFTLSNMCRTSGGSGVITDAYVLSNDTAALSGKVLIYDSSVTAVNDNAAENLSDADAAKLVAEIPFTLSAKANNAGHNVQNLNVGYTCNGSTNLRFLLQATGGTLTTVSANTYTLRVKFVQTN